MINFEESLEIIRKNVKTSNKNESINVEDSILRVLSKDYKAMRNSPEHDKSSMDGIVILKKDLNKIQKFELVGESKAGDHRSKSFKSGQAKLIYTGAPIPKSQKYIVIIKENITKIKDKKIFISAKIDPLQDNIRVKGSDYKKGEICLKKKRVLNVRLSSLAYSLDLKKIEVLKKPRVAIIVTGNEIKNELNLKGSINSSNTITIKNIVNFFGAKIIDIKFAKDTEKSILNAFDSLKKFDLVITSGGLSVGKYDLVKKSLLKRNLHMLFNKVAMKPGKPCAFGKFKNNSYFLGLPGNPVSCFIGSFTFVNLILKSLLGINTTNLFNFSFSFSENYIPKNNNLTSFLRICNKKTKGRNYFKISENQDSSLLSVLGNSDGIIIRKPYAPAIRKGQKTKTIQFKELENFYI